MKCWIQTESDGRIVATMPIDTPFPTDGYREFILPDKLNHPIDDYRVVDGELVFDERAINKEFREANEAAKQRNSFIEGAPEQVSNLEDGLMDVAEISSTNETSIEDLTDAIMELAAMIGGNENG